MSPNGPVKVLDAGVSTDGALPAGQGSDSMNVNHAKASVILLRNGRVRLGDISTLQRVVPPNSGAATSGVNTARPVPAR